MADNEMDTIQLNDCVTRWQAGDNAAAAELVGVLQRRIEGLSRRMLRGFPNVRPLADTVDVVQGSLVRLLHSLRAINPPTTRDFARLAAAHVRRELLDLARRTAAHNRAGLRYARGGADEPAPDAADGNATAVEELEMWARFHEAVEELPVDEREVVGLTFYHGWTQAQIADLFGVDERTIRRRWRAAGLRLTEALGGRLPALEG